VRLGQPGLILALLALAAAAAGCGGSSKGYESTTGAVPEATAPTIAGSGVAADCARAWNAEENRDGQVGLAQWLGVPGLAVHIASARGGCQLVLHDESGGEQVWTQSAGGEAFEGPVIGSGGANILHPLDVTSAGHVLLSGTS
jgi:ABC-type phosphate transport system substrate-binding protein